MLSATEVQPGILEGEDCGEPKKRPIGQQSATKAGVEGLKGKGV